MKIAAAAASRLARYTVELGGKSPNIVFADADLDAAEAGVVTGIFGNAGQTCVAGSRLLVERAIYGEFTQRIARRGRALRLGNPFDEATEMGPIATAPQLERVSSMVKAAQEQGAEVMCGGRHAAPDGLGSGFFFEPTVLAGASNEDDIAQNEVFGPVLVAIPFDDDEAAIRLANSSRYGLAAGVWTRSLDRGHRVARRLQAGMVWLNTYKAIAYSTPFGGYKESGVGRLNGRDAVDGFLQTKTVWHEPHS
jgi:aldehyde dehydrogenase (NAD+)